MPCGKVHPAIHNRISAGAPVDVGYYCKHCERVLESSDSQIMLQFESSCLRV